MQKGILTLTILLMSLWASSASAQSVQAIEQQIAMHLKHIQYWRFDYAPGDTTFAIDVNAEDSIAGANKMLLNYLVDVCARQPMMLKTVFNSLENTDMKVVTSDDKKLAFYSWDTQMGSGDLHFYNIVAQYEASGGTKAVVINDVSKFTGDGPDAGVSYNSLTTINSSRKKYYLPIYTGTTSANFIMKGIHAYSIDGDKLADAAILQGPYETKAKIEYSYDQAANYDFKKMKEDHTLHLDKQKLYVPEVAQNKITGNYMVYVYDGEKFVYDKNAK